jgi:tetratricopeptide (TPR) repeat protein
MTQQEIHQVYHRIICDLDNKKLKNAFDSLQSFISGGREYVFQEKLNEVQDTYKKLLHYRMDGVKDPMQDDIYRNILIAAYELADQLKHSLLSASSGFFYKQRRNMQLREENRTLEELCEQLSACRRTDSLEKYEDILSSLFHKIWIADMFTPGNSAAVRKIWSVHKQPFTTGCQVVSALILALQASFDKEKLLLLFDAIHLSADEEIRIRALIGILITLYMYGKRSLLYPQITERLEILAEEPGFSQKLRIITLRFILTRDTEKITRKLRDEIFPDMVKLKHDQNELNTELPEEKNPEWKELFTDSSLEKKMKEFHELQQEGVDVMHFTFIRLKNFPFFREISNWFLPYTTGHSLFDGQPQSGNHGKNISEIINNFFFMCNSDKYSLYFHMMQLPEEARRVMMEQFNQQTDEIKEHYKGEWMDKQKKFEIISGHYIQDLYRFFQLFPAHRDFDDIFVLPFDFYNLSILQPYMSDEETLMSIADFYLRKDYPDDAYMIYDTLAKTQKENDMLFQKSGYCLQMSGDIKGALNAYLHANLLNPRNKWLIRRIAKCYRIRKQYAEALVYYRHYEELFAEDLSMDIGHCLLALKDYNEALKYYFKADYLDAESHKAWRPIAWCSFQTGRYEQARNYYEKIITEMHPTMHDFLNAGHTEWALRNNKEALGFYLQSIRNNEEEGGFHKFKERFDQDRRHLLPAGIPEEEIPLMLDHLSYITAQR